MPAVLRDVDGMLVDVAFLLAGLATSPLARFG
jgi:hypothetical protein